MLDCCRSVVTDWHNTNPAVLVQGSLRSRFTVVTFQFVWACIGRAGMSRFSVFCRAAKTHKLSNLLWLKDLLISWLAAHNPED